MTGPLGQRRSGIWRWILVVVVLFAAVAGWAYCRFHPQNGPRHLGIALDDLVDHPERYDGKKIAVLGNVASIVDAHVFVLDDHGLFGDNAVLIVDAHRTPRTFDVGARVQVDGTVKVVEDPESASDLAGTDVEDEDLDGWKGHVVIQAEAITQYLE